MEQCSGTQRGIVRDSMKFLFSPGGLRANICHQNRDQEGFHVFLKNMVKRKKINKISGDLCVHSLLELIAKPLKIGEGGYSDNYKPALDHSTLL